MSISFKSPLNWFQKVYLVTDPEQNPWLVTQISIEPNGAVYRLSKNGEEYVAYEGEFTTKPDDAIKLGLKERED